MRLFVVLDNENGLPTTSPHGNEFSHYKSHSMNSSNDNIKRRFEELDSEEDDLQTPARRRRRLLVPSGSESESRTSSSSTVSSKATPSEESEDSDMPRRSVRRTPAHRTRKKSSDYASSDRSRSPNGRRVGRNPLADPTSRRRGSKQSESDDFVVGDDEEGEDVVAYTPTRARRSRPFGSKHEMSEQDKMDLEDDLRDLKGSGRCLGDYGHFDQLTVYTDVIETGRRRSRISSRASKVQKGLERLRRRRAGQKELSDEDDASSSGQPESAEEDNGDEDLCSPADEDLDQYEEDFVEEGNDAELGVPHAEMPFEFTRHAYKDLRECFRDVVEWMVHNKLNPAFARDDPMYGFAFRKLEDEVRGRIGSQFVSSTWNAKFTRTLQARPYMDITGHPTAANDTCDACNRSRHPASAEIRLHGKPYSLETLEPLTDSDESDEESEETSGTEERRDRDTEGHLLYDENKRFLLGRSIRHHTPVLTVITALTVAEPAEPMPKWHIRWHTGASTLTNG